MHACGTTVTSLQLLVWGIAVCQVLCVQGFSLSVLTAIFQVNLGQLVFIEAKDDGGGGDSWTTGPISRAKLQSNHYYQQTKLSEARDRPEVTTGKDTTPLAQLRSGYNILFQTYKHQLDESTGPTCLTCIETPHILEHWLIGLPLHCKQIAKIRCLRANPHLAFNPDRLVYDPDQPEGRLNLTTRAFNQTGYIDIPAVLSVAGQGILLLRTRRFLHQCRP